MQDAEGSGERDQGASLGRGVLYLVATPIGNLEDITLRAVRVLQGVDRVFCEDTRRTGRLFQRLSIAGRLSSCHRFNEQKRSVSLLRCLESGGTAALVSDAGTPGIHDPGARLVREAWEAGFQVEAVPGPCSIAAALSLSGFPADAFHFAGFLPARQGRREKALERLSALPDTLVLFESPHRILKLARELVRWFGGRQVAVCREMTKLHQEVIRGEAEQVAASLDACRPRGEYVVVLGPGGRREP